MAHPPRRRHHDAARLRSRFHLALTLLLLFLPLVVMLFLLSSIALLVHDRVSLRRFPVHAFVGVATLVLMAALTFVIASTERGFRFFLKYLGGGCGSALLQVRRACGSPFPGSRRASWR